MSHFSKFDRNFDRQQKRIERTGRIIGLGVAIIFIIKIMFFCALVYLGYRVVADPSLIGRAAGEIVSGFDQVVSEP